ncbi:MAG: GNAT family N-acetyltransferase [Chloroflexota bacterium]
MAAEHPLLLAAPASLVGPRVVARPYDDGDVDAVYAAVQESLDHLRPWLPWWNTHQIPADTQAFIRRSQGRWTLREEMSMGLFTRGDGAFLGGIGLHPQDWGVPSFEIGYWLRRSAEGHGYMTEAVRLLTTFAFDRWEAQRVFIRCDARNHRSTAVPERLGYIREGCLRRVGRDTSGNLEDMRIYAMIPEDYARARLTWQAEQEKGGPQE